MAGKRTITNGPRNVERNTGVKIKMSDDNSEGSEGSKEPKTENELIPKFDGQEIMKRAIHDAYSLRLTQNILLMAIVLLSLALVLLPLIKNFLGLLNNVNDGS